MYRRDGRLAASRKARQQQVPWLAVVFAFGSGALFLFVLFSPGALFKASGGAKTSAPTPEPPRRESDLTQAPPTSEQLAEQQPDVDSRAGSGGTRGDKQRASVVVDWALGEGAGGAASVVDGAGGLVEGGPEVDAPLEMRVTPDSYNPRSVLRQLMDQMTLAKAYVAVAKENSNYAMAWEFTNQLRLHHELVSRLASQRRQLTMRDAEPAISAMARLVAFAKELRYDAAIAMMKLKAQVQLTEERVQEMSVQSAFFGQLTAEAIPKNLHCFTMRLTMNWAHAVANHTAALLALADPARVLDPSLQHYCIFSDNPLAVAVVVSSAVANAQDPRRCVFHIVTDSMNLGAMQAWFAGSPPGEAALEIQNVDEFEWLDASYSPVLRQLQNKDTQSYYFKASLQESKNTIKFRNPKYLSMLNHLRFYLPEVYPALERVLFLDDDVVIQKDLGELFTMDLEGNVNGAVETCLESFHRYHKYLNFSDPRLRDNFDPEACGWAYGMNVFDLKAWKNHNITQVYHYWQEQNADRTLWKLGTLPPGLLTFYKLTKALDRSWHVLGLGYDPNIDSKTLEEAAVVHYNGNMKPWLKLAMSRYRPMWSKYINYQHPFIQQCNIQ